MFLTGFKAQFAVPHAKPQDELIADILDTPPASALLLTIQVKQSQERDF